MLRYRYRPSFWTSSLAHRPVCTEAGAGAGGEGGAVSCCTGTDRIQLGTQACLHRGRGRGRRGGGQGRQGQETPYVCRGRGRRKRRHGCNN